MKTLRTVLLAATVIGLGATSALASGGGSMPSASSSSATSGFSGPQYDPAAEYAKAVNAFKAKQYRDAARAAQHVADAMPKSPDAWHLLGAAKAGDNDWKGSMRAYDHMVKLAPDNAVAHAGLALALVNMKDPKAQTEVDWLKAKLQACGETCPDAASLKAMSAEVEAAQNPQAPTAPKPSASLSSPTHSGPMLFGGPMAGESAYVQAVSLINQKRYDEALASLADAEKRFGLHPDILTYEGYTWRKKGDYARAEQYYRQALSIDPGHVGAIEYYGELKVATGDLGGARKLLARLDDLCTYGCADAEELRRWIALGHEPQH